VKFICTNLKRATSVAIYEPFQLNESEAVGVESSTSEVYGSGGAINEGRGIEVGRISLEFILLSRYCCGGQIEVSADGGIKKMWRYEMNTKMLTGKLNRKR
jgi:hypothetical protein